MNNQPQPPESPQSVPPAQPPVPMSAPPMQQQPAMPPLNGFDTSLFIMEDYDLILKAKRAKYKNGVIKITYLTSDRRYQNNSLRQALKGIYGELYRYTHGLRVTKPIYEYEMGGKQKKTTK